MVSTVRPRPTHYELLGLKPTAASDEIAKAFARETSVYRPQAFGGLTEACIAYDTLRDPIKRRAYDASLGLIPQLGTASTASRTESSFPAPAYPARRSAINLARPPAPQVQPRPEPQVERKPAPSTPAFQRQPVDRPTHDTFPAHAPKPDLPHRPEVEAKPRLAPQIGGDVPRYLPLDVHFDGEARPIDWKRAGMAAGAVTVGACILGALAGWWSADDIGELPQAEAALSIPLPPSDPAALAEAPQLVPAPIMAEARPDRPRLAAVAPAPVERRPIAPQPAAADPQPQENQPVQDERAPIASDQPVAEAPVASTSAVSMPLPNKTIARTIERIGYSCGGVTSTSAVDGAGPGVFKVTCSSGQSYQARPVNGRYRFKRWSGR